MRIWACFQAGYRLDLKYDRIHPRKGIQEIKGVSFNHCFDNWFRHLGEDSVIPCVRKFGTFDTAKAMSHDDMMPWEVDLNCSFHVASEYEQIHWDETSETSPVFVGQIWPKFQSSVSWSPSKKWPIVRDEWHGLIFVPFIQYQTWFRLVLLVIDVTCGHQSNQEWLNDLAGFLPMIWAKNFLCFHACQLLQCIPGTYCFRKGFIIPSLIRKNTSKLWPVAHQARYLHNLWYAYPVWLCYRVTCV